MILRLLVLLSLVVSTAGANAAGLPDAKAQKAAVKCQKAIDQSGAKLVASKLKSLDACATAVLACIQVKPGDAACLTKATAKCSKALLGAVPQAEVGASAKIVKACGAPLRPADLLAADGLGIGAVAAACNLDFGLNVCANLPTLAQCLVATGSRAAERLFATQQPRASELIAQVLTPSPLAFLPPFPGCQDCSQAPSDTLGKAVAACGATLTKAGRTFAAAVGKSLGGCLDKVFACVQTKPGDAKCLAKAATTCDGAAEKVTGARAKLDTAIAKRCADGSGLSFATLATAAALNLDALADDCGALGVGSLATLGDYVACARRAHECGVTDVLRATLPRTAALVDEGTLGGAGALLDAAACPTSLPSTLGVRAARSVPRFFGPFSTSRWFTMTKKTGTGAGTKTTPTSGLRPPSSPGTVRRVAFPQGAPSRFVPGTSRIVKVSYFGKASPFGARAAGVAAAPPKMIVAVTRGDLAVEDHLEIPLDAVPEGGEGEVEIEIAYDAAPPSCTFDVAFGIDDDGEVSDYTTVEQVADTVPPPTFTPTPAPTATAVATAVATKTATPVVTATPTTTGGGATATVTPTATGPTPSATPTPVFAYALTTNDDPAALGTIAILTLTVTNRTNAPQNATMTFTVPPFTNYGGFGPGSVRGVAFTNVAAGASQSALIPLALASGAGAPPDGTVVTVTFDDLARGASVTRTFTTYAAPTATLTLATAASSVAPGGAFTYALGFDNREIGPVADAELAVAVPAGATFVSAEGGVTPGLDGVVRFPLGTLAGNGAGQRTITFAANGNAAGPLVVTADLRDGTDAVLAHASAATAVYATPVFAYTLTTTDDAVAPGDTALFRITVTNLTNAIQSAALAFAVPQYTSFGGFGGGSVRPVTFANVAPGASQSALLPLVVTTGGAAPVDGTVIGLAVHEPSRGTVVARSVVVRSTPPAELTLDSAEGTVAPGGTFTYALAFANPNLGPSADLALDVRVPDGATFVAADGGAAPDAGGVVRWTLDALAGSSTGVHTVTFAAGAGQRAPLLVEAALRNAQTGAVVTQASAATVVYTTPAFAYSLTTVDDAVAPGGALLFRLTATNLTNAAQDATLSFRVPDFTSFGGFGAGSVRPVAFADVAAGASASALIPLVVTDGGAAPPDGTLIALALHDGARGAAVARSVGVRATPFVELTLATAQPTTPAGAELSYTLAFWNPRSTTNVSNELAVRVPAGATFVSADGGVVPDADGIVRLPIGALAGHESGKRTVTFAANAGARGPLVVEADVHDDVTDAVRTRASAATTVYDAPAFSYTLTTNDDDPIVPGRTATFLLTATNLTNATRSTTLGFRVPDFTTFGGFGAGSVRPVAFANVPAGGSAAALIALTVTSGGSAPPDGTVIPLMLDDTARAAAVSRAIVARSAGRAELKLSTAQATVAPGGAFSYTLSFHNTQAATLTALELALPVPAGASFVAAEGGATPDAAGVVRWSVGPLAGGATGTRTIDFTADAAAVAPLLVQATLRDTSGDEIVAEASGATAVYATPTFSYTLVPSQQTVSAGQTAAFVLSVKNLSGTTQTAAMGCRVPDFTAFGGFGAGSIRPVTFSNVAAGATVETTINLTVTSGGQAPPTGTLISLTTIDGDRGAAVSSTIVVGGAP